MEKRKLGIRFADIKIIRNITISDAIDSSIFKNLLDIFWRIIAIDKKNLVYLSSSNISYQRFFRSKIINIEIGNFIERVISENIIDFRLKRISNNIILWRLHDKYDISFFELVSRKEKFLKFVDDETLDSDSNNRKNKYKKDYQTWNFHTIKVSLREMENSNVNKKPNNCRANNIKEFFYLRARDIDAIESLWRKKNDIDDGTDKSKVRKMPVIDSLYRELDSRNQICHETDITCEKKKSEYHEEFYRNLYDTKEDFMSLHMSKIDK